MASLDLVYGRGSSPFIGAIPFDVASGFGSPYSAPGLLPSQSGNVSDVACTPPALSVHDILHAGGVGGVVTGYPWSPGSGFGVRYTGSLAESSGFGVTVAPVTGTAVVAAASQAAVPSPTTPIAVAARWTPGVGFGAGYTGAVIGQLAGNNQGRSIHFSPTEAAIVLGLSNTFSAGNFGGMAGYPWSSGGGFGVKFADPSTLAPTGVTNTRFSPAGGVVVSVYVSQSGNKSLTAYPWSDGSGFGVLYAGAPVVNCFAASGLAFSPDGAFLAYGNDISPFLRVYAWSDGGGYGAKVSDPASLPPGSVSHPVKGIAWTPDGTAILVGSAVSPFLVAYPWSAGGFGAKYSNPSLGAGDAVEEIACITGGSAPPSPTQPDDCGPKNLTPKPLSVIDPEPVVKTYPHVTEITDWPAQQSIKLLWDRIHDHESRLRAGVANDQQWVGAANSAADAVKAAQLTADHALAQAAAAPTTSGGGTGGGGESGGDGGSPDDPEAGDGFNNRFATGHPPSLPVPLTSYTAGQIVGGVANEFPALFANFPSDAETVAACQEYVLRTIWHLQQAGFVAGRQRNPSLLISNDKITIFIDGTYRAYDIASLGGAGSPNVAHILRVSPADYVADAGTPD